MFLLVLLCFLPSGLAPSQLWARQADAHQDELLQLRFKGNQAFSDNVLRDAIVTRATRCRSLALLPACWFGYARDRRFLDERVLEQDVLRLQVFYQRRGYRESTVAPEMQRTDRGVRLVLHIEEGRPVRVSEVQVTGKPEDGPPELASELPLQEGDVFDLFAFEGSRDSLSARLRNAGYIYSEVLANYSISHESRLTARVQYDIVPGKAVRFGSVDVTGTDRVPAGFVKSRLTFGPGDEFREKELLRSRQNLFGINVFSHVEIEPADVSDQDTVIPVTVRVQEGLTRRVRTGVGLSTAECFNAEGRWTNRNFMGGARWLELRGRVSNVLAESLGGFPCFDTGTGIYSQLSGSLAAEFTQPWFLGWNNALSTGVFMERRSVPDVFVRTAVGAQVSLRRTIGRRAVLSLGYSPELTRLDAKSDVFFCISHVACSEDEIEMIQEPHWLAPVKLSFQQDRSNAIFAPTAGHILRMDLEHASGGTGSDFKFSRIVGEFSAYRMLTEEAVGAFRLRSGLAQAISGLDGERGLGLHPQKRFFAGGANSVRGFAQSRLGPKILTVDAANVLAADPEDGGAGCTGASINDGTCDPRPLSARRLEARPVGGAAILEGNLELRFPLAGDNLDGATFVDFGQVWSSTREYALDDLAWTPGVGVRYESAIGPVRVDVGYNTAGGEWLSVITTQVCAGDPCTVVTDPDVDPATLQNTTTLQPLTRPVHYQERRSFFDRLQLHISIGQAF